MKKKKLFFSLSSVFLFNELLSTWTDLRTREPYKKKKTNVSLFFRAAHLFNTQHRITVFFFLFRYNMRNPSLMLFSVTRLAVLNVTKHRLNFAKKI